MKNNIVLFQITLSNYLDDTTETKIVSCAGEDVNVINNIDIIARNEYEDDPYSVVSNIERITPVNLGETKQSADYISEIFNS